MRTFGAGDFFDVAPDWSRRSRWLSATVLVSLFLMNIKPVNGVAGFLLAGLAAICGALDPCAAFAFIAGSQIAPDPAGFPFTLAQLFVVAWLVTLPINGTAETIKAIPKGLRYIFPFMALWTAIGILNGTLTAPLLMAFVYAFIAAAYVPLLKGGYSRALLMLGLGALIGVAGHWGTSLGLSMEGEIYIHPTRGGLRIGSGRGDVNLASVNVGFALWTIVAFLVPHLLVGPKENVRRYFIFVPLAIIGGAIPLIAMGSRGGLAYLGLGGLATVGLIFCIRQFARKAAVPILVGIAGVGGALALAFPILLHTGPGQMLQATIEYNMYQASTEGSGALNAGRNEVWGPFLESALEYPLFGPPAGTVINMGEFGYNEVASGLGAAHNVLLDIASERGFPTVILFLFAFFAPVFAMWRKRGGVYAYPFVIAHVSVFLPFMNLSLSGWKTFWVLHVLTTFAAHSRLPQASADDIEPLEDDVGDLALSRDRNGVETP